MAPALRDVPLDCMLPLHRLSCGRTAVGDAPPGFIVGPLVVENSEGWLAASDLASGERLEELFAMPERLWDAPSHAAAVLAWKTYTYRLAQPLATAWALAREVPLLSPDNVLVKILPGAPYITLGLRRATTAVLPTSPATRSHGAVVVPDETALLDFFRSTLVNEHLRPLLRHTMQTRRVGERVLWGQAAAALAYAFSDISVAAARDAKLFADVLPVQGLAGVHGDDTVWRNTCCLAFASPSLSACRDCTTVTRLDQPIAGRSAKLRGGGLLRRHRGDAEK
jgi:hypothetical protein